MNVKPLIVDKQTEELIKNGALAFVEKIEKICKNCVHCAIYFVEHIDGEYCESEDIITHSLNTCDSFEYSDDLSLPYQTGDKVFLQEEYTEKYDPSGTVYCGRLYKNECNKTNQDMIKWTRLDNYEQSRYRYSITVEIVRVQDIPYNYQLEVLNKRHYLCNAENDFIEHCKSKNINYNTNEYVALYTLERIKQ